MVFRLTVHLGNAAMESPQDVARALTELSARLAEMPPLRKAGGEIRDDNGNTCGGWEFDPLGD